MANGPFYRDETRPFAQRCDSMSLDIIHPKDIPKGKVMYCKDELLSLKTEDLPRARPHYDHLQYLNKPDFSVGCTDPDHAGARARSYYPPMDRRPRDLSLTTADIEYAQPKSNNWKGNRHTDPVCPVYELPSCARREQTPPRWNGRHTNDIRDIEKSGPKVLHPDRNYRRDPNDARDIEYATPNYEERVLQRGAQGPRPDLTFDVRDINGPKRVLARGTNPLEPVYTVPTARTTSLHATYDEERAMGMEGPRAEPDKVGPIQGSRPRKLQWDNGEPQFSLLREDIPGTVPQRWVGSVPHNIYDPPEVRAMVSFHDPSDIPGAQVGTLRKGIQTGRVVNPLNPRYPMLDGNLAPPTMPYVGAERQGPGTLAHPLLRSMPAASSLPNLHAPPPAPSPAASGGLPRVGSDVALQRGVYQGAPSPAATGGLPQGEQGEWAPSPAASGRLPRGGSEAALQRGAYQGAPRRPPSSGRGSSVGGPAAGHLLQQRGPGSWLPSEAGSQPGDLSRRSSTSNYLPRGARC